jgi:hypothetical protein
MNNSGAKLRIFLLITKNSTEFLEVRGERSEVRGQR